MKNCLPDTDIENGGFDGLLGIEKMMKCSTLCTDNSEPYFRACVVGTVHYDTSGMKLFMTNVSLQHEPKASDVITLVKKKFSHEYRPKFYITKCENANFHTRNVRETAFYTRSDIKVSNRVLLPGKFTLASEE